MKKMREISKAVKGTARLIRSSIAGVLSWQWTKALLYWLIVSAGTMSACAFLIASVWMCANSSVHKFILLFLTEETTTRISDLATTAYVVLPEFIVALAVLTVYGHIRMWLYNRSLSAAIWTTLYALPTLVFLVLSLITLACSVTSTTFQLPEGLIVTRALAGYMYAFTELLHHYIGKPQEVDRLQQKDDTIAQLRQEHAVHLEDMRQENERLHQEQTANLESVCQENARALAALQQKADTLISELRRENQLLRVRMDGQSREIESQKEIIEEYKTAKAQLQNAMQKTDEIALQAYSEACLDWLKSGVKTANVEEIMRFTGLSKRKIEGAISKGSLQTSSRNRDLVLMSTLVPWLRSIQRVTVLPESNTDEMPALHLVNG